VWIVFVVPFSFSATDGIGHKRKLKNNHKDMNGMAAG
jgi:hypothetical protein